MRWTCPKCGKKLEISNEQLIANDGVIVCPQCLLQAHQPVPKARISPRQQDTPPVTPQRRQQRSISFDTDTPPAWNQSSTPPPIKSRMKQPSTTRRYNTMTDAGTSNTPRPAGTKPTEKKRTSKKKKKKKNGMSAWGCLGRTVVFTLVLFAAYVFFGLLLEALQ